MSSLYTDASTTSMRTHQLEVRFKTLTLVRIIILHLLIALLIKEGWKISIKKAMITCRQYRLSLKNSTILRSFNPKVRFLGSNNPHLLESDLPLILIKLILRQISNQGETRRQQFLKISPNTRLRLKIKIYRLFN